MTCDSGGTVEIYVEPVLPLPRLLLFGNSAAVQVLARLGHAMGYRVEVIDADADPATFPGAERVLREIAPDAVAPGVHVLVATMSERDLEVIAGVAPRAPAYLGIIASPKRFAQLRDALLARGLPRGAVERIAAPAGLDIGARTPEEIALSIMAQIVERRRRPGREAARGEDATPASASPREKAQEAVDPVCGMSVATTGARHHARVKGRTYYFCCEGCRAKFLADPARYATSGAEAGSP
jgi:xanthine dehydrogenase accessory factor